MASRADPDFWRREKSLASPAFEPQTSCIEVNNIICQRTYKVYEHLKGRWICNDFVPPVASMDHWQLNGNLYIFPPTRFLLSVSPLFYQQHTHFPSPLHLVFFCRSVSFRWPLEVLETRGSLNFDSCPLSSQTFLLGLSRCNALRTILTYTNNTFTHKSVKITNSVTVYHFNGKHAIAEERSHYRN